MEGLTKKIDDLEGRIDRLVRTQIDFQTEITRLREELRGMRASAAGSEGTAAPPLTEPTPAVAPTPRLDRPPVRRPISDRPPFENPVPHNDAPAPAFADTIGSEISEHADSARANLEKFIGENLISKIGILVLIIGVGIGVKYSIDNDMISPMARIVLAYLFGFGLVALAIKLKAKYLNFSAALISGGLAILYFVTYFGCTAYSLIGRAPAFGLMTVFTVLSVVAAIFYNRQVIAHIGLVGAYAVPFLLSEDTGNYLALFAYMAVINAGILAISIRKYWRSIFYTASGFTWLIFAAWLASRYGPEGHFELALSALAVFFSIFLATKLVHTIVHAEHGSVEGFAGTLGTVFSFYTLTFAIVLSGLSTDQTWIAFSYLCLATAILVALSFRFFSRGIVYLSFAASWVTFAAWYGLYFNREAHASLALIVAGVIFSIFYFSAIAHRLVSARFSLTENSSLILTNSFVAYGFGYAVLNSNDATAGGLGVFTAANAGFHLAAATLVGRLRKDAEDVVLVLSVLIITFASITIPVQFDGNFVTMAWAVEASILFWFGRVKGIKLFEYFSYPLMLFATGSLFLDWSTAYENRVTIPSDLNLQPFANGNFVTALVYIAAFAFIFHLNRRSASETKIGSELARPFAFGIAGVLFFVVFNTLRLEISNYFHIKTVEMFADGVPIRAPQILDIEYFNVIWQINYSMVFTAAVALINLVWVRSRELGYVNMALGLLGLGTLATAGMVLFHELRLSYLEGDGGYELVTIRYVSYAASAILLFAMHRYTREQLLVQPLTTDQAALAFEALAYTFVFIVVTCELVNQMAQFGLPDGTKLGVSICWGLYALMLISVGIALRRKHLRVAAIILLAVTLAKLFFYDAAGLDTIPRTILFVSLGLTLLLVSFLYNKYKYAIFGLGEGGEEQL